MAFTPLAPLSSSSRSSDNLDASSAPPLAVRARGVRVALVALPALLLGLASASCGTPAGAGGEAVRPKAPSAAQAITDESSADGAIACRAGAYAEPLVVDLSGGARVDFEAAMDAGVALVHYDCKAVRLLKDCRLEGNYRFAGVSRKEEVIHLDNRDEIRATIPIGQAKLGGELDRASALDIALVMIGKRSTPAAVSRTVLEGSQCGEATHFVRAATVGAFAIKTATKGRVAASAELFSVGTSGESASEKETAKRDGDPSACAQSKPGADAPPGECRSAIRFELVPVSESAPVAKADGAKGEKGGDKKKGDREKGLEDPCPEGFRLSAGKCAKATGAEAAATHLCAAKDREDCEKQCAAGHQGSCYNLGTLAYLDYGKDVPASETKKNEERARTLWKGACEAPTPVLKACTDYADELRMMKTPEKLKERFALLKKTCDGGEPDACYQLASDTLDGDYDVPKDAIEGMQYLRRSCKLGDRIGCSDLAEYFFEGKYVAKDPKAGDEILRATCAQGDHFVCRELAEHLLGLYEDSDLPESPVKEIPNARERGRAILASECKAGGAAGGRSCGLLGRLLVESDDAAGRPLLEKQCPTADSTSACGALGWSLFEGKGGSIDKKRGLNLMIKSETERFVYHAANALLTGKGIGKDVKRGTKVMTGLCTEDNYKPACENLGIDRTGKKVAKK